MRGGTDGERGISNVFIKRKRVLGHDYCNGRLEIVLGNILYSRAVCFFKNDMFYYSIINL